MSTEHPSRAALWATGGSVLSAILASACCWLPLALLVLGLSAAGVAATFEKARPFFLIGAALLLGTGFYLNYFRKQKCEAGSECAVPNTKLRSFNRSMLWIATLAVLAFAMFPNYVGALLGGAATNVEATGTDGKMVLHIEGMTCDACALHVRKSLESLSGVHAANVSYADRKAVVSIEAASPPSRDALRMAIQEAGYDVVAEPPND